MYNFLMQEIRQYTYVYTSINGPLSFDIATLIHMSSKVDSEEFVDLVHVHTKVR